MTTQNLPLTACRILVTRASHQAGSLSDKLRALGAVVFEFPVIGIAPPDSWDELDRALRSVDSYDWVVFASTNAVEFFMLRALELKVSQKSLLKPQVAAIGPATLELAKRHELSVSFAPGTFVAENLVDEFPGYPHLQGKKILWPKTNIGRTLIADKLREAQAQVDIVTCYKTTLPADAQVLSLRLNSLLRSDEVNVVTIASSQSARNLALLLNMAQSPEEQIGKEQNAMTDNADVSQQSVAESMPSKAVQELFANKTIAVIGPQTSASAKTYLGKVDIESKVYTIDGLVQAICHYFEED